MRTTDEPDLAPPDALGKDTQTTRMWSAVRRSAFRILIVTACLVILVPAGFLVFGLVDYARTMRRADLDSRCLYNLKDLADIYVECSRDPDWTPRSGPALLLQWRREGKWIPSGREHVLTCRGDEDVQRGPAAIRLPRYDTVDLDDPPDDLCSFAVRDFARFPVDGTQLAKEPILACVGRFTDDGWKPFHEDAFVVAFADGSSSFLSAADLGLAPGSEPIVGPDSPSPILRVLCFHPGRTEGGDR